MKVNTRSAEPCTAKVTVWASTSTAFTVPLTVALAPAWTVAPVLVVGTGVAVDVCADECVGGGRAAGDGDFVIALHLGLRISAGFELDHGRQDVAAVAGYVQGLVGLYVEACGGRALGLHGEVAFELQFPT